MSDEKKLKILKALKAGKIDREQATGLMDKHGIEYKKQAKEPEEPGLGSKALDVGLRALDWTGGMGRMGAAGLTELATLGNADITRVGDFTRALKGDAPLTDEYLDRAGMEEGLARAGIGLAGDVALDPATYITGGAAAASKYPKFMKFLRAADIPFEQLGKGIKGLYKSATRGAAPKAVKAFSGVDEPALKSYLKNPKQAKMISENGEDIVANDRLMNGWELIQAKKRDVGARMTSEIRESGKMVDISDVKDKLQKNITDLYNKGELSSLEIDYLAKLKGIKDEIFTSVDPKTGTEWATGNMVTANRASRMKDDIAGMLDVIKDPATVRTSMDKKNLGMFQGLNAELSKSINKAVPKGSAIKKEWAEVMRDEKFFSETFKNTKKVDPKFDPDAFNKKGLKNLANLNTSTNTGMVKKVQQFDTDYGTKLIEHSDSIKASRQLVNPAIMAQSSNRTTATARTMMGGALGAGAYSAMSGEDSLMGYSLGALAGGMLTGPRAMRRMMKTGYGAEKLAAPIMSKVPTSMYRRMGMNTVDGE